MSNAPADTAAAAPAASGREGVDPNGVDQNGVDQSGVDQSGVDQMSYEQARDALVTVVDELERGGTTLEQSLALWERGEALATRCETWLIGARARLDAARGTASVQQTR